MYQFHRRNATLIKKYMSRGKKKTAPGRTWLLSSAKLLSVRMLFYIICTGCVNYAGNLDEEIFLLLHFVSEMFIEVRGRQTTQFNLTIL